MASGRMPSGRTPSGRALRIVLPRDGADRHHPRKYRCRCQLIRQPTTVSYVVSQTPSPLANGFPVRSVVAFPARSLVAFPAQSVVAFPAQSAVAFPARSEARVGGAPVRIPDYGLHVQDGSRAVKKYFHPVSTSIALLKAPDATREGPQHEASTLRCPSRGPIRRNSSCLEAGNLIGP